MWSPPHLPPYLYQSPPLNPSYLSTPFTTNTPLFDIIMASACLNRIGISPENNNKYSSYAWFSPRLSIGREEDTSKTKRISSPAKTPTDLSDSINEDPVKDISDLADEFDGFEFRLDDPVMMLPADELFSDGKLIPLHLSVIRQEAATSSPTVVPDTPCSRRRSTDDAFAADPYLFSPRAPRQLLNRSSKSSNDLSINLPLLTDNESISVSVSSRPSLSSSSSGHDLDDLPRLSLDSDKPGKANTKPNTPPKTRQVKTKTRTQSNQSTKSKSKSTTEVKSTRKSAIRRSADAASRGLSVDSPRMSSSGKIVFHSLERSSSSPSSFNGGPRFKHKGVERSYSANVRITPVLNVPVCSLIGSSKSGTMFGFPIFSSQQKREGCSTNIGGSNRSQWFVN
ncbi:uncharacterized protein LOC143598793 [Bidens hawaiensis]|uniref:uncharacterized protein LOC143598793 n=1 Tax=Bidens hawaiensis TaxID=980011 RepID=UPI004049D353